MYVSNQGHVDSQSHSILQIAKSLALWPYAGLPATGALVSQWSSSVSQPQNGARHTQSKSNAFRRFADRLPLGQTPSFRPTDSATEGMGLQRYSWVLGSLCSSHKCVRSISNHFDPIGQECKSFERVSTEFQPKRNGKSTH